MVDGFAVLGVGAFEDGHDAFELAHELLDLGRGLAVLRELVVAFLESSTGGVQSVLFRDVWSGAGLEAVTGSVDVVVEEASEPSVGCWCE